MKKNLVIVVTCFVIATTSCAMDGTLKWVFLEEIKQGEQQFSQQFYNKLYQREKLLIGMMSSCRLIPWKAKMLSALIPGYYPNIIYRATKKNIFDCLGKCEDLNKLPEISLITSIIKWLSQRFPGQLSFLGLTDSLGVPKITNEEQCAAWLKGLVQGEKNYNLFKLRAKIPCAFLETKAQKQYKTVLNALLFCPLVSALAYYGLKKMNLSHKTWAVPASVVGSLSLNAFVFGTINHFSAERAFNKRRQLAVDKAFAPKKPSTTPAAS